MQEWTVGNQDISRGTEFVRHANFYLFIFFQLIVQLKKGRLSINNFHQADIKFDLHADYGDV